MFSKKMRKIKRMVLTSVCFFYFDFSSFFFNFLRFLFDFGKLLDVQKSIKNRKNRVRDAFGARFAFFFDFGSDFGTTLGDFGWDGRILDRNAIYIWRISFCMTYFDD